MEKNLYHLSPDERRRLGIEQLPETLGEAIELTAESELVLRTLGEHMFNRFVEIKRQEWEDYRSPGLAVGAGPVPADSLSVQALRVAQRQRQLELGRLGDRQPAGEVLADVGRGAAVDAARCSRSSGTLARVAVARLRPGEHDVRAGTRRGPPRASRPTRARRPARPRAGREVEVERLEQVAERLRMAGGEPRAAARSSSTARCS